ncbi:MAG: hypothetical protein AAF985_19955 [Bacteroidota bacterium]
MYSKYFLFTGLLFLCLPLGIHAQYILPNFQSQTTYKDQLLIRWEPRDLAEWENALKEGYQIKVYKGSNSTDLNLVTTETILAQSEAEWDRDIANQRDTLIQSFYEGAKSFLYMPEEIVDELKASLEEEEGKTLDQTVAEFRLGYLTYAITFDYQLIRKAGLGFAIPIDKATTYRVEVQTGNYPSFTFDHQPQPISRPQIPDLKAEFSDKKVMVEWETPDFKEDYFGYFLALSKDGKRYTNVSDMPYVNILDTIQGDPDLRFIKEEVPLERNYKNYWVRLKGMNYFGLQSRLSSIEKGYGFDVIDAMPTISHADQTSDNKADLRWALDQKFNRLIDHFEIYRSDDMEGEYKVVQSDIPPSQRNVLIPMEHKRNYYSVAIVPKDGPIIRSFSTFIMGQDTTPPITPQNFVGVIDSMGIVTLSWDKNTEDDLWGYKVFRSEYKDDEFGNLHSSPITDTVWVDTVNLKSINDKIHYTIIALDKRNNRSPFAPIVSLERPDTIPPAPPLVRTVEFMEDSIKVTWAASSSDDAVLHQLFRREINESGWELIAEQRQFKNVNVFMDTMFEYDKTYVYTALAVDKVDLTSAPSRPFKVYTKSNKPKAAFLGFDIDFDEEKALSTIRWELTNENILEEIIIYRGPSKDKISMYQIVEPDTLEIAQQVGEEEQWYFLFKPIFTDGSQAELSDIILVEQPE